MKTILISLAFTFITLQSFAQENSVQSKAIVSDSLKNLPHFKFKDIPIDGSLNKFVSQLKKQNFTVLEIKDKEALLSGKFADEEVDILVQASTQGVFGVAVAYKKRLLGTLSKPNMKM